MNDIDGIQSSPPALLPPNTSFTPHIQTLVDYYKSNYEYCQSQDVTAMKGYGIQITVPPPSISTDNNHQQIVMNEINRGSTKIRLKKWLLQSVLPRRGNILPPGDITIAFSVADRANNETKKTKKQRINNKCQFSSSAHKGQNSVYNFQDMYNSVNNVTYPKALPWKIRDPIPVFRGSYWGVPLSTNNKHLKEMITDDMDYEQFNKSILKAGEMTATIIKENCEGWYQYNRETIAPILDEKNKLLHKYRSLVGNNEPEEMISKVKKELNLKNKHAKEAISLAKARWYNKLSTKIHDMNMNPKVAWEYIRILTGGETAHHKKTQNMAMRMENGKLAKDHKDNMKVMYPHFQRVFNNHRPVDSTILQLVKQRPVLGDINLPINWDEFNRAVNKLKNDKAPGLNGIPPEAYKAMDGECRTQVFKQVCDFFDGKEDYNGWHKSQCIPVPKSGDLSNPNKWRGVMLMDVCSKIFSIIMTERAFKLLKEHGTAFQFGGTPELGCRDGLFTIKTLLNMRKNHNMSSFVAFVDLVKAYDTANHDLLLRILERYGAPPRFVDAISRMYKDLVVVLKIEKSVEEILQEVGVRQGDNMAPVLFLFLMSAFAETLEEEWKRHEIEVVTVGTTSSVDLEEGKGVIKSHAPDQYKSKHLTAFEIIQCLYVDDGAFIFSSRSEMSKGLELVYQHFARFGLEMHIGRDGVDSKTECVFFPAPNFFRDHHNNAALEDLSPQDTLSVPVADDSAEDNDDMYALTDAERKKEESEKARIAREDKIYDDLEETQDLAVADGFVSFTRHFKYLGSYISYNLRDDYDIESRIAAASQSMGALKNVWNNPHMEIYSKYLLFRAIPMNLLLWGCETWSLRQVLLNKLEVFLHRSIRRILGVPMSQVKEERIRNIHMRQKFYDIPRARNMIAARQMDFVGKMVRGPDRPTKSMLTACCPNTRLPQRPQFHNKDALVKNLKLLFGQVHDVTIDDQGSMKDWINEVMCEEYWNGLVRCLLDKSAELPERPATWTRRRRSPRNHENSDYQHPFNDDTSQDDSSNQHDDRPPSPPRRSRVPPRRRREEERQQQERPYDPEMVGRSMYDSFKVLGLGLGASEAEVKQKYRELSRLYHPDKHDTAKTGMTDEEAEEFCKLINNAYSHLREIV